MRVVDAAVLTALRSVLANVHDGDVPVDSSGQVVTSPLPYVVFYSAVGTDEGRRASGEAGLREVAFQYTYVGGTRDQAKWAGEKARGVLGDQWLTVDGRQVFVRVTDSQLVRRDDDAARPDGGPLFYGVDVCAVTVALTHA